MKYLGIVLILLLTISVVVAQLPTTGLGVPTPYPVNPAFNFQGPSQTLGQFTANFGVCIDSADVNGDGVKELLVCDNAFVYAVDQISNSILRTFTPPGPLAFFNQLAAVKGIGDITGDGIEDVLIGDEFVGSSLAPPGGRVIAYNGATGGALYTVVGSSINSDYFGRSIDVLGDVNGNGVYDFAVGEPGPVPASGTVYIFEGSNGTPIGTILSPNTGNIFFGNGVASTGDVDADGVFDLIVGSNNNLGARAYVFSGATRSLIFTLTPPPVPGGYSVEVASGKDYDLDGINDFFLGDYVAAPNGKIYVYSGSTGALLTQINGIAPSSAFGFNIKVGDINGDSATDIITYSISQYQQILVYSGLPPTLMYSFRRPNVGCGGNNAANCLSIAKDSNLLDNIFWGDGQLAGSVYVEKLGGVYSYGAGTLQLTFTPNTNNGAVGTLMLTGAAPNEVLYAAVSAAPYNLPLPSGANLYVDPNQLLDGQIIPAQADSTGSITLPGFGIQDTSLAGQKWYFQIFGANGQPLTLQNLISSNALEVTYMP